MAGVRGWRVAGVYSWVCTYLGSSSAAEAAPALDGPPSSDRPPAAPRALAAGACLGRVGSARGAIGNPKVSGLGGAESNIMRSLPPSPVVAVPLSLKNGRTAPRCVRPTALMKQLRTHWSSSAVEYGRGEEGGQLVRSADSATENRDAPFLKVSFMSEPPWPSISRASPDSCVYRARQCVNCGDGDGDQLRTEVSPGATRSLTSLDASWLTTKSVPGGRQVRKWQPQV
jgi:hypothetical protein